MKIDKGKRVFLKIKLMAGDQLIEENAVEYFQGAGTMLPGLEKVVEGLEAGAVKKGELKADDAFGDEKYAHKKQLSRKEFPEDAKLEPGLQFAATGADNSTNVILRVKKVTDETVDVVMLHPLADKDISYELEVLKVTDPTPPPPPPGAVTELDADLLEEA